jgi:hypothetical protein
MHLDTVFVAIHDTTTIHGIDLVDRIDAIYNRSFTLIATEFGILAAMIGIVLPIIIAWWQSRTIKLREKELEKKIELTQKSMENALNFKETILNGKIEGYNKSIQNVYDKYMDMFTESFLLSRLMDIKISIKTSEIVVAITQLSLLLNDAVNKDGIYKSIARREALGLLKNINIDKIEAIDNKPNDTGITYGWLYDSEKNIAALLNKKILEEQDEIQIQNILSEITKKRNSFDPNQKGIFSWIESRT